MQIHRRAGSGATVLRDRTLECRHSDLRLQGGPVGQPRSWDLSSIHSSGKSESGALPEMLPIPAQLP